MKKYFFLLCLLFTFQSLDAQIDEKPLIESEIFFIQNEKKYPLKKSKLRLNKAPFTIQVNYSSGENECLLVNIRTDDHNYQLARSGQALDVFPASGMAEYPFNPKKELWVEKQAYHCWFYEDESNHRYDKIQRLENYLVSTRTVENIRFMNEDDPGFPIEELENKVLYLTFFQDRSTDYNIMDLKIIGAVKIRFR